MKLIQTVEQPLRCTECEKPIPANETAVMVIKTFEDRGDTDGFFSELYCQKCWRTTKGGK